MRRVRRQDAASGSVSSLISSNIVSPSNTGNIVSPTDPTGPSTTPTTTQDVSTTTSNTSTTPTSTSTSSSGSSSSSSTTGMSAPTQPPGEARNDPPNTTDESLTSMFTTMSGTRIVTITSVVPNPSAVLQHSGGSTSFWDNRGAVIATFTLVGIAIVAILGVAITASFRRKRRNRKGEIERDSHFLDDDDNGRLYSALSEKTAGSPGISPAAASFSEKWGSGSVRHPYAAPPANAELRRTIVELPMDQPISRPPSAFLSLHASTRPSSMVPPFDPSMLPPGPRSVSDDHHHPYARPPSHAWDHPHNPGHPFSDNQLSRGLSQNNSLPPLPDQPHHQHAPALQHSRQFSDPRLLNRMSRMEGSPSPTPPPDASVNRHHSFGANTMLGLSPDGNAMSPNRHHSLGAGSLLMPMTSRTPSPVHSNYDASVYSRTPGSSADYGNRKRGTGDWSIPNHSPSQSSGSNYTYQPPTGYDRTRDPRFSAAFGVAPSRSTGSVAQMQPTYYPYPGPGPQVDPRFSGMMMGSRPGPGSSASVAYTYSQPPRPETNQSLHSRNTASRPGTGNSAITVSSERHIHYLRGPGDASASSSTTTHVNDHDEPLPTISATSLQTTTTETRANDEPLTSGKSGIAHGKAEGSQPSYLLLPGDALPKDNSDATSLKDDVDYTPGWIGSLLIANE